MVVDADPPWFPHWPLVAPKSVPAMAPKQSELLVLEAAGLSEGIFSL